MEIFCDISPYVLCLFKTLLECWPCQLGDVLVRPLVLGFEIFLVLCGACLMAQSSDFVGVQNVTLVGEVGADFSDWLLFGKV